MVNIFLKNLFFKKGLVIEREFGIIPLMNLNTRPANTFQVGSLISIDGVPAMKKLRIDYISDGCVTVYGKDSSEGTDHTFTISGSSPAIPYEFKREEVIGENGEVSYEVNGRAPRGSFVEKMKNPKIPSGKFSVSEFSDLNEVPYQYGMKWIKENCSPAGFKERVEGQRGKSAELFQKL